MKDIELLAKKLNPEGFQPWNVLLLAPKKYDDLRMPASKDACLSAAGTKEKVLVQGFVLSINKKDSNRTEFEIQTIDGQSVNFSIFGYRIFWPWSHVKKNDCINIFGEIEFFGHRLFMKSAEWIERDSVGFIRVRYPRIYGMKSKKVSESILLAMENSEWVNQAAAYLESQVSHPNQSWADIIKKMHRPSEADVSKVLAFLENISAKTLVNKIRNQRVESADSKIFITQSMIQDMRARIGFVLSKSQLQGIYDVCGELESDYPSRHLISGDVGSGKTIVYAIPAILAQNMGKKVAILIPNELLARQVCSEIVRVHPKHEEGVILVLGESKKTKIDQSKIIIGTTAILSRLKNCGYDPDILIIDEQQKLSEKQRMDLCVEKTNIIESTATCIPGTYGKVLYGASTSSIIFPHVDKNIQTKLFLHEEKIHLFQAIKNRIHGGATVAIIYPLREGDSKKSTENAKILWEKHYPDQVVMLHGGMNIKDKLSALELIMSGEKRILVSTTVIEIGLTIPLLTSVSVIGAEHLGASTLHQLRGRASRHGGDGFFDMLYTKNISEDDDCTENQTIERLRILETTNDGFKLAELDAQQRGIGNMLEGQHGKTKGHLFYGIAIKPKMLSKFLNA